MQDDGELPEDGEDGEIVEEVVEEEVEEVVVEETIEVHSKAAEESGYNDEPMETVEGGEEGEIAPKEELAKHDKRKGKLSSSLFIW